MNIELVVASWMVWWTIAIWNASYFLWVSDRTI